MNPPAAERSAIVKEIDGLFASRVAGPIAYAVVRRLINTRVTPNQVTWASFLLAFLAAYEASWGELRMNLLAVVFLQASFVLDMVDGQLARARGSFSPFGAFLDRFTDRVGEAVVYAGAASGAVRLSGDPAIWPLAYTVLSVVFLRDLGDQLLGAQFAIDADRERELSQDGLLTRALRRAGVDDAQQASGWVAAAKSFLWLGIGERMAILSMCLVFRRPDVFFWLVVLVGAPSYFGRMAQKLWRLL